MDIILYILDKFGLLAPLQTFVIGTLIIGLLVYIAKRF